MLYPDLNDLMAFQKRKIDLKNPSFRAVQSQYHGNHLSPFRGQGLEFDSVRAYVPGDDIRSIDWRVTARTGAPHIKLFKEDRQRQLCLCVDVNATMRFGTRNTFKSVQAARTAALLGWRGIAQQEGVSGYLFGDVPTGIQYFSAKRAPKSFAAMLKMLSEPPQRGHKIPLEQVLKCIEQTTPTRGALIYVISDFMHLSKQQQIEQSLSRLSTKHDLIFIAINDPADQILMPMGKVGFCANEREKISVDTQSVEGRQAYLKQWNDNRQSFYALTSKMKISTLELTTQSDVPRDLMLNLKRIQKCQP